jgi:NAD(P)-dependent dehydrogenase (short-subunit alcohol dehydrogenase family)
MNETSLDMSVLVTGATGGIGRLTADALARRGARVLVHGRTDATVDGTVAALAARGLPATGLVADLSSLQETAQLARAIAARTPDLDVLINNAGVGFGRDRRLRERSRDGFELRLAVNYLAPFLLTHLLLERGLPRRAIVNVASIGQEALDFEDLQLERGYDGIRAYRRSKLALVMLTFDLAQDHPNRQIHALHPGTLLDTSMVRDAGIAPHGPASDGAQAIQAVLATALAGGESGRYFDDGQPTRADPQAYDALARRRLREAATTLVAPFRVGLEN